MNEKRKNAIRQMPKDVTVITKQNIHEYILPSHPLHPAYEHLSSVHKSDYLRCYLMHHHGGGYSDVKSTCIDWDHAKQVMEQYPNVQMMGVRTTYGHTFAGIELWTEETKKSVRDNLHKLVCMGYLMCKSYSDITTAWYTQLHSLLDEYLPQLQVHAAKYTRECFDPEFGFALPQPKWESRHGEHTLYPISWNLLLAQIMYPIQIQYIDAVDSTTMIHNF